MWEDQVHFEQHHQSELYKVKVIKWRTGEQANRWTHLFLSVLYHRCDVTSNETILGYSWGLVFFTNWIFIGDTGYSKNEDTIQH